jgi:hypothetical protein
MFMFVKEFVEANTHPCALSAGYYYMGDFGVRQ